jgi:hypothetical protein
MARDSVVFVATTRTAMHAARYMLDKHGGAAGPRLVFAGNLREHELDDASLVVVIAQLGAPELGYKLLYDDDEMQLAAMRARVNVEHDRHEALLPYLQSAWCAQQRANSTPGMPDYICPIVSTTPVMHPPPDVIEWAATVGILFDPLDDITAEYVYSDLCIYGKVTYSRKCRPPGLAFHVDPLAIQINARHVARISATVTERLLCDFNACCYATATALIYASMHRVDTPATQEPAPACVVCMENARNTLFQPCNHLVACQRCSRQLDACPVCRTASKSKILVFIP